MSPALIRLSILFLIAFLALVCHGRAQIGVVPLGHTNNGASARAVALAGPYAYIADDTDGLRIYDCSTPSQPVNIAHQMVSSGKACSVALSGNYAFVGDAGLQVYDVCQ